MASVRKEIALTVPADRVWAAVADFGALHVRLVPGFVTDTRLDHEAGYDARTVTFRNGTVARELLVASDPSARRLVYAVAGGAFVAHSASVQVLADGDASCRLVWISDFLPHDLAGYIDRQMDEAALAMRAALTGA